MCVGVGAGAGVWDVCRFGGLAIGLGAACVLRTFGATVVRLWCVCGLTRVR